MTTRTKINQVDFESVTALIGAIQDDPAKANTVWNAKVDWKGGFKSESTVRQFAPVGSDEPGALGGDDTAPNPVEQLLSALGNCLAVGYAANATAAGISLENVEIELEGTVDLHTFLGLAQGHAGYDQIEVKVRIDSDADAEQLAELHKAVVSTSPVGHTLSQPIPVNIELA